MTFSEFEKFHHELRDDGISLWIETVDDGADIVAAWPAHKLTAGQIATLKVNKPAIITAHRRWMTDLLPPNAVCEAWRRQYANTER